MSATALSINISSPPAMVGRSGGAIPAGPAQRTKLWEFNSNLHCSIIGTCLSTGELRQVLKKLGLTSPDSTDHDLHGVAVSLAARHDKTSKALHKALDHRHHVAIHQFGKAKTEDAVRSLWSEAVRRGDIPGAYWAVLTHPVATQTVIRDAFGEVHMLSHLVGAANRADIRRLCKLEEENAQLQVRLERQQAAFRDAVVTRDRCIHELRQALATRVAAEPTKPTDYDAALHNLVADLERRLSGEIRRSIVLGERLTTARAAVTEEHSSRLKAERESAALHRELGVVERTLRASYDHNAPETLSRRRLDGITVLYIGGRPHQVAFLRAIAERLGATFLHHDGGVEDHLNVLAGFASQAELVVFPVDCISHHAALAAKQHCRQTGKVLIPLRSASATSLLAALQRPEVVGLADAAD